MMSGARSPPVRGWPELASGLTRTVLAFPACAGMARLLLPFRPAADGVPRLCGDGPEYRVKQYCSVLRSPPVRGWPVVQGDGIIYDGAFPACAGMARHPIYYCWRTARVPRLCGDGPVSISLELVSA